MVDWFNTWSKGIVVSVIIATLIEMVLPENKNKKYVKMVIGIFVMYTIITPIIKSVANFDVDKSSINFNSVIETSSNADIKNNIYMDDSVKKIYAKEIQNDIKTKLESKGYITGCINVKISNDQQYNIEQVDIEIKDITEDKKNQKEAGTIVDAVQYISIKISNNKIETDNRISEKSKDEVKQFIKETYDVPFERITIQ